jgi:malate synthase
MEDAATAEICRAQLWQWVSAGITTCDGTAIDTARVHRTMQDELDVLLATGALDDEAARHFTEARDLLAGLLRQRTCPDYLTLPAYLQHLAPRQ